MEQPRQAIDDCTENIAKLPTGPGHDGQRVILPEYYWHRGLAHLKLDELDLANADFAAAIELGFDDEDGYNNYYNRGVVYDAKDDLDLAIADYDRAIRLDPGIAAAFGNRDLAFLRKRQYERALADFESAIAIDPGDPIAHANHCLAYYQSGDLDQAIAECSNALRHARSKTSFSDAKFVRGLAYRRQGRFSEADADIAAALLEDPTVERRMQTWGVELVE